MYNRVKQLFSSCVNYIFSTFSHGKHTIVGNPKTGCRNHSLISQVHGNLNVGVITLFVNKNRNILMQYTIHIVHIWETSQGLSQGKLFKRNIQSEGKLLKGKGKPI